MGAPNFDPEIMQDASVLLQEAGTWLEMTALVSSASRIGRRQERRAASSWSLEEGTDSLGKVSLQDSRGGHIILGQASDQRHLHFDMFRSAGFLPLRGGIGGFLRRLSGLRFSTEIPFRCLSRIPSMVPAQGSSQAELHFELFRSLSSLPWDGGRDAALRRLVGL